MRREATEGEIVAAAGLVLLLTLGSHFMPAGYMVAADALLLGLICKWLFGDELRDLITRAFAYIFGNESATYVQMALAALGV